MDDNKPTQPPEPSQTTISPAQQSQIDDLDREVDQLEADVKQTQDEANARLDEAEDRVTKSGAKIDEITGRLDAADKAASDEFDEVILEELEEDSDENEE